MKCDVFGWEEEMMADESTMFEVEVALTRERFTGGVTCCLLRTGFFGEQGAMG